MSLLPINTSAGGNVLALTTLLTLYNHILSLGVLISETVREELFIFLVILIWIWMVSSRKSRQEQGGSGKIPIQDPKWRRADHTKQASISGLRNVIKALWMNDKHSYLETFVRRVVREEVEHKFEDHFYPRARVNQAGISGAKPFQLCFINKLPDTIFTLSNIVAEDESSLQIALFDVRSQSVVNDGPLSSLKIEITVLNGEFGSSGGSEDWTEGEFSANILRERDGKGPLLIGERFITLKNGVGCISRIILTDNSRWLRSRKFRLGAKVVQPISGGANIKEGRSEPFVVKDNRGESYKKHYPPSLDDDIWRLEKIAKDGKIHERLSLHGIHTVKDLLQLYTTNPSSLYAKCGNIPNKSWLAITKHAKTCEIDDRKLYSYHTAEQPIVLLFNSIYILVGVTFDGINCRSPDTLAPDEKHLVEIVKQLAYKNVNNLKSIDETSLSCFRPAVAQSDDPEVVVQEINVSSTAQGQQETWPGFSQPFSSDSYVDENVPNYQIYGDPLPQASYAEGGIFSGMYNEGDTWLLNGSSHFPIMQGGYSTENYSSEIQLMNGFSPYTTTWGQQNGSFLGSSDGAEHSSHSAFLGSAAADISGSGKPIAAWFKILNALKWVISVRRDAAARKNAELLLDSCGILPLSPYYI